MGNGMSSSYASKSRTTYFPSADGDDGERRRQNPHSVDCIATVLLRTLEGAQVGLNAMGSLALISMNLAESVNKVAGVNGG